jgi:deoxycytidylate deaminase
VHAEMDAIPLRSPWRPWRGHLFVTTFPCHNCTRHILATGIKKVYYIGRIRRAELAISTPMQSASIKRSHKTGKVPFLPFVGIGPRPYLTYFRSADSGRKFCGKTIVACRSGLAKGQALPGFRWLR